MNSRFLGAAEWLTCVLLMSGFWNWKSGVLGAITATLTFVATITITLDEPPPTK